MNEFAWGVSPSHASSGAGRRLIEFVVPAHTNAWHLKEDEMGVELKSLEQGEAALHCLDDEPRGIERGRT